jgi:hypothetical protein
MPATIAALLLALGCAPATFTGPAGAFAVWVCPPAAESTEQPATPPAPPPPAPAVPEREA